VATTPSGWGAGHGDASGGRLYRWLLRCVRAAWVSCAVGVIAMVPALVLRSPQLVTVFRVALVVACAALAGALLFFVSLVMLPEALGDVVPGGRAPSVRRRIDLLLTVVLVDLLDPE
jgi:zinc transporter ZupT